MANKHTTEHYQSAPAIKKNENKRAKTYHRVFFFVFYVNCATVCFSFISIAWTLSHHIIIITIIIITRASVTLNSRSMYCGMLYSAIGSTTKY